MSAVHLEFNCTELIKNVSSNTKIELSIEEAFCGSSVLVSIFHRRLLFTARVLPQLHKGRSPDPGCNFLLNNLR